MAFKVLKLNKHFWKVWVVPRKDVNTIQGSGKHPAALRPAKPSSTSGAGFGAGAEVARFGALKALKIL